MLTDWLLDLFAGGSVYMVSSVEQLLETVCMHAYMVTLPILSFACYWAIIVLVAGCMPISLDLLCIVSLNQSRYSVCIYIHT